MMHGQKNIKYYLVFVFTVITACRATHAKFGIETDYIKFYMKDCLLKNRQM